MLLASGTPQPCGVPCCCGSPFTAPVTGGSPLWSLSLLTLFASRSQIPASVVRRRRSQPLVSFLRTFSFRNLPPVLQYNKVHRDGQMQRSWGDRGGEVRGALPQAAWREAGPYERDTGVEVQVVTSRTVGGPQRSGDQVEETQDAAHSAEGDDAEEIRAAKLPATRGAPGRGSPCRGSSWGDAWSARASP